MMQPIIFAADQYTFHKACITAMLLINGTNSLHEWHKSTAKRDSYAQHSSYNTSVNSLCLLYFFGLLLIRADYCSLLFICASMSLRISSFRYAFCFG